VTARLESKLSRGDVAELIYARAIFAVKFVDSSGNEYPQDSPLYIEPMAFTVEAVPWKVVDGNEVVASNAYHWVDFEIISIKLDGSGAVLALRGYNQTAYDFVVLDLVARQADTRLNADHTIASIAYSETPVNRTTYEASIVSQSQESNPQRKVIDWAFQPVTRIVGREIDLTAFVESTIWVHYDTDGEIIETRATFSGDESRKLEADAVAPPEDDIFTAVHYPSYNQQQGANAGDVFYESITGASLTGYWVALKNVPPGPLDPYDTESWAPYNNPGGNGGYWKQEQTWKSETRATLSLTQTKGGVETRIYEHEHTHIGTRQGSADHYLVFWAYYWSGTSDIRSGPAHRKNYVGAISRSISGDLTASGAQSDNQSTAAFSTGLSNPNTIQTDRTYAIDQSLGRSRFGLFEFYARSNGFWMRPVFAAPAAIVFPRSAEVAATGADGGRIYGVDLGRNLGARPSAVIQPIDSQTDSYEFDYRMIGYIAPEELIEPEPDPDPEPDPAP
jgi:hypothetical protein